MAKKLVVESPNNKRRLEVEKQIREHPGTKAHNLWDNLARAYQSVYRVNREHLVKFIAAPGENDQLSMELMQNQWEPKVKEAYMNELSRLIHNYIASSFTLVDHTRYLMTHYQESDFQAEYELKKTKVIDMPEHHFLKDFRNYVLHRNLPPIDYTVGLRDVVNNTFELRLNTPTLLEWDGWTKKAEEFVKARKDKLVFVNVINTHGQAIDELNIWLLQQFTPLHSKDIADVNELMHLRNDILSGKA